LRQAGARTIAAMVPKRFLQAGLIAVAGGGCVVTTAAAQVPHSLSLSGPPTATVGQPSVLQASGTVSDDPSVYLARYINMYALPVSVVPTCPATYQNALQIKDSTTAQGGQTVALSVPVDGSFSVPLAFNPTAAGRFLLCGYLHEGVGTDAMASLPVDVAAPPSGGGDPANTTPPAARPSSLAKPTLSRSGRKLVCGRGTWSGAPTTYAYRWTVDGKRKAGAVGRKLRISRKLRGHTIRCGVTATNAAGSTTALSRARRL
jgi:hypothetical protein